MKIPFYAEFLFFYAEYNNMGANSYEKPDFWSKKRSLKDIRPEVFIN